MLQQSVWGNFMAHNPKTRTYTVRFIAAGVVRLNATFYPTDILEKMVLLRRIELPTPSLPSLAPITHSLRAYAGFDDFDPINRGHLLRRHPSGQGFRR